MYRLLIPLVLGLFGSATLLAQVPKSIQFNQPLKPAKFNTQADMPCNAAGTYTLGAFMGQSNDTGFGPGDTTIYLCGGDQIFVDHNGDFDLSGDPQNFTAPGIGWAFYTCPPTVGGDNLAAVLADPCIWPGASNGLFVATDQINGDIQFNNTGALQNNAVFNPSPGAPLCVYFAPITLDNFATQGYELNGPCVNVNVAAAFKVVYLNPITADGITPNAGDDCLGRFRISGGLPEFEKNVATYDIKIYLTSDPSVKAIVHTPKAQLFDDAVVFFSAPQGGTYTVEIEDGKSCGHIFQVDMTGCNPSDNVVLNASDTIVPPGGTICVPITVDNFSAVSAAFSLQWDPAVLGYGSVQNIRPPFNAGMGNNFSLNLSEVNSGLLGVVAADLTGTGVNYPDGTVLFEVCFAALGALGDCSPLLFTNDLTQVQIEDVMGNIAAVTGDTGSVCIDFLPLEIQVFLSDTTCIGSATLNVVAEGGQAPYEVIISTLPASVNILGTIAANGGSYTRSVQSNTYVVCVTDENGIGTEVCDTITVDLSTLGAFLQVNQLPQCFGDSTGNIQVNVFNGSTQVPPAGYSFAWSPASVPSPTGFQQVGVSAGTYTVTVTDPNGCTAVAAGTLGQPTRLNRQNVSVIPATCSGVEDGQITYTVIGGTPFSGNQYAFTWGYRGPGSTSITPQGTYSANPHVFAARAGGTYFVTVTDSLGCTFMDSVEVNNLRTLEIDLVSEIRPTCFGLSDGSLSIEVVETPAFPTPQYAFFWFPSVGTQTTGTDTDLLEDLPAGQYIVLATEVNTGCGVADTFNLTQPAELLLNTGFANPTCPQPNGGSISATATGGTGAINNFIFEWENAAGPLLPNGNSKINLVAGTYTVSVTDINGCQDSATITLVLPPPPAINGADITPVVCGGDGCLDVLAPTGVSFIWSDTLGNILNSTTTSNPEICNLDGGTYIVLVTDADQCVAIDTFTLAPVVPLSISDTTLINPSCFGSADGTISIGIQGGLPGYTVTWTPAGTGTVITGRSAGPHIVRIQDLQGCVLVDTFALVNPPSISITSTNYMVPTCPDSCNGGIELQVLYVPGGGNPPFPGDFSFSWSQDNSTDSLRNDLCPGTYTVTVRDANNCFNTTEIQIISPPEIDTLSLTINGVSCFGDDDGSAVIVATAGNGAPFTYLWSTGSSTGTATNLSAQAYNVSVTDRLGCRKVYTVDIPTPDQILVSSDPATSAEITCFGGSDGAIGVLVNGGIPPYDYIWNPVAGNTSPNTGLTAGNYALTVRDANGCTSTYTETLDNPAPVLGDFADPAPILCNGGTTSIIIESISGGAGAPYTYSVNGGVPQEPNFSTTVNAGLIEITYFDFKGCAYSDTINIPQPDPIIITFPAALIELELGDSVRLIPTITGGNLIDQYLWSPLENLTLSADSSEALLYTFESGTYTLTVVDAAGCTAVQSIRVEIDPNRNVYIPNIFKPHNPGGTNDFFKPFIGLGVEKVNFMRVYDRWGEQLFNQEDFVPNNDVLSEGWDGRYKGKLVNPGVYIYVIEVKFLDERVLIYRGDITVVR